MKQLDEVIRGKGEVKGIFFVQLFRFKDLCLYYRSDRQFEIIKARQQKATTVKKAGVEFKFEEKEYYPKGETWGLYEWCTAKFEKAIERYNQQAQTMAYDIELKIENIRPDWLTYCDEQIKHFNFSNEPEEVE